MDELPVVRGLMVCERVEQDRRTGNVSIYSRFSRFRSRVYPSPPRLVSAFVVLTNGFGPIPLTLTVVRLGTDDLARGERRVVLFADRLAEVQVLFHLPAFAFPAAGDYEFTLYAADEPLASQRVQAVTSTGGTDEP